MPIFIGDKCPFLAVLFIADEYVWHLLAVLLEESVKPQKKPVLFDALWFSVLSVPSDPSVFLLQ